MMKLCDYYYSKEFNSVIQDSVYQCDEENSDRVRKYTHPFPVHVFRNLLEEDAGLSQLQDELMSLTFQEKNNDLYKFQQSADLKELKSPLCTDIRLVPTDAADNLGSYVVLHKRGINISLAMELMYTEVADLLGKVTGIDLNDNIALTCSKYEHTDTLLCHDDELEGRRIAFVYYLVPEWSEEDGGLLDLYDCDEKGCPSSVVQSIVPERNSLVWFEVTPGSYHQVSEVLTSKTRLSLNGWFHGKPIKRPELYKEPAAPLHRWVPKEEFEEKLVSDWINPMFLMDDVQHDVRRRFERDSELQLTSFFQEDKYQQLAEAFRTKSLSWELRGPPIKRNYEVLCGSFPPIVDECAKLMRSEAFFLTLANLTGLDLHPLANNSQEDSNSSDNGSYIPMLDEVEPDDLDDDIDPNSEPHVERVSEKLASPHSVESNTNESTTGCQRNASLRISHCSKVEENTDDLEPSSKRLKRDDTANDTVVATETTTTPVVAADVKSKSDASGSFGASRAAPDDVTPPNTEESSCQSRCSYEVRSWKHGSYSMLLDTDTQECALDALLWRLQLLRVKPQSNSLALVYREQGTSPFVKHINSRAKDKGAFQDLSFVYYER